MWQSWDEMKMVAVVELAWPGTPTLTLSPLPRVPPHPTPAHPARPTSPYPARPPASRAWEPSVSHSWKVSMTRFIEWSSTSRTREVSGVVVLSDGRGERLPDTCFASGGPPASARTILVCEAAPPPARCSLPFI